MRLHCKPVRPFGSYPSPLFRENDSAGPSAVICSKPAAANSWLLVPQNELQARALWLVGVCGNALPPPEWAAAFHLLVDYMTSQVKTYIVCLFAA